MNLSDKIVYGLISIILFCFILINTFDIKSDEYYFQTQINNLQTEIDNLKQQIKTNHEKVIISEI